MSPKSPAHSLLFPALAFLFLLGPCPALHAEDDAVTQALQLMDNGHTAQGIALFEKLAAGGDDNAMVQLGIYHYEGSLIPQDHAKAMDWWLKALEKGNADALSNLAVLHRDGKAAPANKKVAYCVFLTIHMCGLGDEGTQYRAGSCLGRLAQELTKEDLKDCLSNYTLGYLQAYLQAKGQMQGIPEKFRPSDQNPALKDLDWWMDGELDAVFGPPSEEEKQAREARRQREEAQRAAIEHTLAYEIRFPAGTAAAYDSVQFINDTISGSGPLSAESLERDGDHLVVRNQLNINEDQHRLITLETKDDVTVVFRIKHPAKPAPADWTPWLKPDFLFDENTEGFNLRAGEEPKTQNLRVPANAPELRFRVYKEAR